MEIDPKNDNGIQAENQGMRNLLARHDNDWAALATELYTQTFQLRDDRRKLRAEVETLKASAPGEGVTVLTEEQEAQWKAYQDLGTPQEIVDLKTSVAKTASEGLFNGLVEKYGLNADAARALIGDSEISKVDGEDGTAFFSVAGAKVADLLEGKWRPFASSLVTSGEGSGTDTVATVETKVDEPSKTTVKVVKQAGKSNGEPTDLVDSFISNVNQSRASQKPLI